MHYISQEIVNRHCSRHTLIGLFGHCPEAKTHFTLSNPKRGFNLRERNLGPLTILIVNFLKPNSASIYFGSFFCVQNIQAINHLRMATDVIIDTKYLEHMILP